MCVDESRHQNACPLANGGTATEFLGWTHRQDASVLNKDATVADRCGRNRQHHGSGVQSLGQLDRLKVEVDPLLGAGRRRREMRRDVVVDRVIGRVGVDYQMLV